MTGTFTFAALAAAPLAFRASEAAASALASSAKRSNSSSSAAAGLSASFFAGLSVSLDFSTFLLAAFYPRVSDFFSAAF